MSACLHAGVRQKLLRRKRASGTRQVAASQRSLPRTPNAHDDNLCVEHCEDDSVFASAARFEQSLAEVVSQSVRFRRLFPELQRSL
jgi:hypothetical protein